MCQQKKHFYRSNDQLTSSFCIFSCGRELWKSQNLCPVAVDTRVCFRKTNSDFEDTLWCCPCVDGRHGARHEEPKLNSINGSRRLEVTVRSGEPSISARQARLMHMSGGPALCPVFLFLVSPPLDMYWRYYRVLSIPLSTLSYISISHFYRYGSSLLLIFQLAVWYWCL